MIKRTQQRTQTSINTFHDRKNTRTQNHNIEHKQLSKTFHEKERNRTIDKKSGLSTVKYFFFGLILWMCIPSFSGRATPDVIISKLKCSGAFVA